MNNNRYNEIINEAYTNYINTCNEDKWMKEIDLKLPFPSKSYGLLTQEEFIDKIKTDDEFAKKWGLTITERELSLEERIDIGIEKLNIIEEINENDLKKYINGLVYDMSRMLNDNNIPTRVISLTYNNETIEIYE
jgi:hypothetical protein